MMPTQGAARPTLHDLREWRAFSLSELAERSGVDRMTIHRIERGRQAPHPATRRKLAEALRMAVEDIDWIRNSDPHRNPRIKQASLFDTLA